MAGDELQKTLLEDELKDVVVLVLANKQDLPHALRPEEVVAELGLDLSRNSRVPWCVQGCCATTGLGLYEALDWLSEALTNKDKFKAPAVPAAAADDDDRPAR